MDVKELTEWIFDIYHDWENIYGISGEQSLEDGKKMDEVIERLKRGEENEKYKKIVEEIEETIKKPYYTYKNDKGKYFGYYSYGNVDELIDELKQKYFPKETSHET